MRGAVVVRREAADRRQVVQVGRRLPGGGARAADHVREALVLVHDHDHVRVPCRRGADPRTARNGRRHRPGRCGRSEKCDPCHHECHCCARHEAATRRPTSHVCLLPLVSCTCAAPPGHGGRARDPNAPREPETAAS